MQVEIRMMTFIGLGQALKNTATSTFPMMQMIVQGQWLISRLTIIGVDRSDCRRGREYNLITRDSED